VITPGEKIKTDVSKTIYVGGIYEVDKNSGGTVTGTKTYYPAAGATLAPNASAGVRVGSTQNRANSQKSNYFVLNLTAWIVLLNLVQK